jgi:hypothetical protein
VVLAVRESNSNDNQPGRGDYRFARYIDVSGEEREVVSVIMVTANHEHRQVATLGLRNRIRVQEAIDVVMISTAG